MKLKPSIFLFLVFLNLELAGQTNNNVYILKGNVVDIENGKPIPNSSVFLNGSSKGTISTVTGVFELTNILPGKYELIISSIGYETYVFPFSTNKLPLDLVVKLKRKASDLTVVTVQPFLKDGWETWGRTFIDNFIGTTVFAKECKILNKEVVRFRYSQKDKLLTAFSEEPILIENKALGYLIKFQLEEFTADFGSYQSIFTGYPLFSNLPAESKAQEARWMENREKAYYGSLRHFIHCLYIGDFNNGDQFNQEGFEVRQETRLPNLEKQRVKEKYNDYQQLKDDSLPYDSVKYFKKVLKQEDSIKFNRVLSPADLILKNEDSTKTLFFSKTINIVYRKRRKTDTELQKSSIYLITPATVEIQENGYYYSPLEIFTIGHWAKFQKLANLLPLDYWPEPQSN